MFEATALQPGVGAGSGDHFTASPTTASSPSSSRCWPALPSPSQGSYVVAGPSSYPGACPTSVHETAPVLRRPLAPAVSVHEMLWPEPFERFFETMADVRTSYVRQVSGRCPCCCALSGLLIVGAISGVGLAAYPLSVETNFDTFMKGDSNVSSVRDSFEAALSSRMTDVQRRLQDAQLHTHFNLWLSYELKETSSRNSILERSILSAINRFEQDLMRLPAWQEQCARTDERFRPLCNPGLSVACHSFPGVKRPVETVVVPESISFDGTGLDALPLPTVVQMIEDKQMTKIVFPKDFNRSEPLATKVLRSVFQFKLPCCRSSETVADHAKANKQLTAEWKEFISGEVLAKLQSPFGESPDTLPFRVFFEGHHMQDIEVMEALFSDVRLATGSICFVLAYLLLHTKSIFLSIAGISLLIISVPLSYTIFSILAGQTTMSIASFLSFFLVAGLGSDVIFVFTDVWIDSASIKDNYVDRLSLTLLDAGKATLATSSTTAFSFFANLTSVLRPLREFGVFTGLCVLCVWILIAALYAPLCLVDEMYCESCSLRRSSKPCGSSSNWQQRLFSAWITRHLHRWRQLYALSFPVMMVALLVPAAMLGEADSGLPDIFPEDHNRNRGTLVFDQFEDVDHVVGIEYIPVNATSKVCKETQFEPEDFDCPLFWCETPHTASLQDFKDVPQGQCQCWRKQRWTRSCGENASIEMRIVGPRSVSAMQKEAIADVLAVSTSADMDIPQGGWSTAVTAQPLAEIVLQDWETGTVVFQPVTQITTTLVRKNVDTSHCGWQELCFCGTSTCLPMPGWDVGSRFPISDRRLSVVSTPMIEQVSANLQAVVDVSFGIHLKGSRPLLHEMDADESWAFAETFDLSDPWTQRSIYTFCTDVSEELLIVRSKMSCWILDFKDWLEKQNERFPVPQHKFETALKSFITVGMTGPAGHQQKSSRFLWLRDGPVPAKACRMAFIVDLSKHSHMDVVEKYKVHWDKYVHAWTSGAGRYPQVVFHSSWLWVRSKAQVELMSSMVNTLVLIVVFALIGMLVSTADLILSICICISLVSVHCSLAFFVIVVMRWQIGPIEVIGLTAFTGIAITYPLHIAQRYGSNEGPQTMPLPLGMDLKTAVRYQRTSYALKSVGGAALGSAITTIGCIIFLLFCTLSIFVKLGAVVLVVTMMSICTALALLPAMLLTVGPLHPGRTCHPSRLFSSDRVADSLPHEVGVSSVTGSTAVSAVGRQPLPVISTVTGSTAVIAVGRQPLQVISTPEASRQKGSNKHRESDALRFEDITCELQDTKVDSNDIVYHREQGLNRSL